VWAGRRNTKEGERPTRAPIPGVEVGPDGGGVA
jgi:hypothetical protein